MAGSAPRIGGRVRACVPLVVGRVVGAVGRVQLVQPGHDLLQRGVRRQVQHHRAHLGAQEVVGAGRAQRGQPRVLGAGHEVEHDLGVGVVADLRPVGRGQAADHRRQLGRAGAPPRFGQRLVARDDRAERIRAAVRLDELRRGADDLQRAGLALAAGPAPGGDAVPAEDAPDGLRVAAAMAAISRPSWKPGRRHGTHATRSPKHSRGQLLPVGGGGQRDARVRVQVIDVRLRRPGRASRCRWTARPRPVPCRQKSNAATISSSRSTPG